MGPKLPKIRFFYEFFPNNLESLFSGFHAGPEIIFLQCQALCLVVRALLPGIDLFYKTNLDQT